MRLRTYQAADGDCYLLSSADERHMLIDGGRSGTFKDNTAKNLSECDELDVVCVSHIDADHITGILKLLEAEVDWRVHLFEKDNPPSGRSSRRKPSMPRPPSIKEIWHNGFGEQAGDEEADIRRMLSLTASSQRTLGDADDIPRQHYLADLALGEEQAIKLTHRIGEDQLNIPLNAHFFGKLIRANSRRAAYELGDAKITVIGPFDEDIEALRQQWRKWLDKNTEALEELRDAMQKDADRLQLNEGEMFTRALQSMVVLSGGLGERSDITTPNLASIMFLAEEGGRKILMTGDGASQDVLKGLKKKKRRDFDSNGCIHVDILKIPHHGASANLSEDFARTVIADHYVFSGNGSHKNPEEDVVKLIIDSRSGPTGNKSRHEKVDEPYTLHFNNDRSTAKTQKQKKHMTKIENLVGERMGELNGQMNAHFHRDRFFDIVV